METTVSTQQSSKPRRIVPFERSLSVTRPDLAAEFDLEKNFPLAPQDMVAGTHRRLWWRCRECSHLWLASGDSRANQNSGCPACDGKVATAKNNLAVTHPELAQEFCLERNAPLTPEMVIAGTKRQLWWQCSKCGHHWQTNGDNRVTKNSGCPACAGRVATPQYNLAITHPHLIGEWSKRNVKPPTAYTPKSHQKVWWQCQNPDCCHEWRASCNNRTGHQSGCPACAGKIATPKNNLAVKYPHLLKEYSTWNEEPATAYTPKSHKKVWWHCRVCGYEWQAQIYSRASGRGCPSCANRVVTKANSLAFLFPDLAAEFSSENPVTADQIVATTGVVYQWNCRQCGHVWKTTPSHRVKDGSGCPKCAVERQRRASVAKVIRGKSFSELYPHFVPQYSLTKNPLPPSELIVDGDLILWWQCQNPECDHQWQARLSARLQDDLGCPECYLRRQNNPQLK